MTHFPEKKIRLGRAGIVGAIALAILAGAGLTGVHPAEASAPPGTQQYYDGPELYRWLDRNGVVRYTPELDRIPLNRRDTAVRVVRGRRGRPADLGAEPIAQPSGGPGANPWNAPAQVQQPGANKSSSGSAAGSTWPELDARIAELEQQISEDEETLKAMISAPRSEGSDPLIRSPELREVAARLPLLQTELDELISWRDQSDVQ
jgi:hypothetical protein